MGKSTETFSKKEREKKKLRKQQDKREKTEDRKANSAKGKTLDEMMAYVDENGNITSTPPDHSKRRTILSENRQIGTPKEMNVQTKTTRRGIVSYFI